MDAGRTDEIGGERSTEPLVISFGLFPFALVEGWDESTSFSIADFQFLIGLASKMQRLGGSQTIGNPDESGSKIGNA